MNAPRLTCGSLLKCLFVMFATGWNAPLLAASEEEEGVAFLRNPGATNSNVADQRRLAAAERDTPVQYRTEAMDGATRRLVPTRHSHGSSVDVRNGLATDTVDGSLHKRAETRPADGAILGVEPLEHARRAVAGTGARPLRSVDFGAAALGSISVGVTGHDRRPVESLSSGIGSPLSSSEHGGADGGRLLQKTSGTPTSSATDTPNATATSTGTSSFSATSSGVFSPTASATW